MKTLFLGLLLATVSLSQAQTKLTYTFTVSKENIEKNYVIISDDFGPSIKKKGSYIWQKHGPGYHYSIRLKPHKVIIRYTGRAKQMERKIKALRKRILH